MTEYGKFIAITCLCSALLTFITYKLSDRGVKMGLAVIFLGAAISPLFAFGEGGVGVDIEIPRLEGDPLFEEKTKEAYEAGVAKGIAEVLMTDGDCVSCTVHDFSLKEVRAKRVTVYLSGISILSDTVALEGFLTELGFEDWEVIFTFE